jgi:hypothetical protein
LPLDNMSMILNHGTLWPSTQQLLNKMEQTIVSGLIYCGNSILHVLILIDHHMD